MYYSDFRNLTLVGHWSRLGSREGKIWIMCLQSQKFDQVKHLNVLIVPLHEDDFVHFLTVSKMVEQVQKDIHKKKIATYLLQDTSLKYRKIFPF